MVFNTPIPLTYDLPHDQEVDAPLTFTGTPTNFTTHIRQASLPRRNGNTPPSRHRAMRGWRLPMNLRQHKNHYVAEN